MVVFVWIVVVTAQWGAFVGVTAGRSSSLSNRQSLAAPAGYGSSRAPAAAAAAAAGGEEDWQVVALGMEDEECEGEGDALLVDGYGYNRSAAEEEGEDFCCEMVPLKQQQQQRGAARLARTSPPRRRKDTATATAASAAGGVGGGDEEGAAAAADDSASSSNSGSNGHGVSSRQQQQEQQQQPRVGSATAAAAAVLLRGASQVLLLPVVNSLLPVSTIAATSQQQQQQQQQQQTAAARGGNGDPRNGCIGWLGSVSRWMCQLPVISTLLHCIYCGVLWVRAAFVLLQLAASAASLPSLPLLLLLAGPAMVWSKANWRLAAAYGPTGLLLSPVLGWLPVFLAVWLHTVRRQMGMGGWGCGGCCTKGGWRIRTD